MIIWFHAQVVTWDGASGAHLVSCVRGGGRVPTLAIHYVMIDASVVRLLLLGGCGSCVVD